MATVTINSNNTNGRFIHPLKVILYLSMASMLMFFAVSTSALLVKKGDIVSWQQFKLPSIFYLSTLILVVSTLLMHFAKNLYANAKFSLSRIMIALSILVALVFIYTQLLGFKELTAIGMPMSGNASGSFIWFLVGAHALHIVGGLVFTLIILIRFFMSKYSQEFKTKTINTRRLLSLELLTAFWHFIDFIWIYLFIFFYFNYQ